MKKVKWFLMLLILFGLIISPKSSSTIYASEPNDLEVVFVIDASYSMNTTDPHRISAEVLNLFIDLNENSTTQVGFVFYNDKIVDTQPLIALKDVKNTSILKDHLNSIPRNGFTDPGLGLHKAQELFQHNRSDGTKRAVILLTDGEVDLPNGSARTMEEAESDINEAINKAKEEQYPIYTVGLNNGGKLNNKHLEHIAEETGATFFNAKNAHALLDIFQTIFKELGPTTHYPIDSVNATGKAQAVNVDIPYGISEGTIVLLSPHSINETSLNGKATIIEQHQSNHYTIINLKEISESSLQLRFKGILGDLVTVSFFGNQELLATLELPSEEIEKDKPVMIRSTLVNHTGNEPLELREDLHAELIVKQENGTELRLPMVNMGTSFELEESFSALGTYEAKVLINGEGIQVETDPKTFELIQTQPFLLNSESITINMGNKNTNINLNDYFSNLKEDNLTFEIVKVGNDNTVNATIKENILTLTPVEIGETTIDVQFTDQVGRNMVSTFHISVESSGYSTLMLAGISVLTVSIVLIFLWFVRKNYSFVGRIEGIFYQTDQQALPSKMYWPLTAFNNRKRISLAELFSSLDITENLPGADQIILSAGRNVLTMKHDSKCIILKGSSIVPRKQKVVINNNEKLLITFENGETEVELLYKATKRHEVIESYSYSN
nr:VWA domain-containing protein [Lysinibacillus timonensis]